MQDGRGVSFHSSNSQDVLMPSTNPHFQKGKEELKQKPGRPDETTSDHNDFVKWPLKPFFRLAKAATCCHSFEESQN